MTVVLNVAEKPSVAKGISRIIGQGRPFTYLDSASKYNPIVRIPDVQFEDRDQCDMIFTSVRGHLTEVDYPDAYNNWRAVPPESLLSAPLIERVAKDCKDIEKNLQRLAQLATHLVLWLDCDREGEAICFEVINLCLRVNSRMHVKRARFSAVTDGEVDHAIKNLEEPNELQAQAVNVRRELDMRIGTSLTRLLSTNLPRQFEISTNLLSYGPCQMPTLGFVVARWIKMQKFKPQQFYTIYATLKAPDGTVFECDSSLPRIFDKLAASLTLKQCLSARAAKVSDMTVRPTVHRRPKPMNTLQLAKLCADKFHLPSHQTMTISEKLYTRGIISYPRTETEVFSRSMNLQHLLELHQNHPVWGSYVRSLQSPVNPKFHWPDEHGRNDQAHPPIHPVKSLGPADFDDPQEWNVYRLITMNFLAACSDDAKGEITKIVFGLTGTPTGVEFVKTGVVIKEENFLEVYKEFDSWRASEQLPNGFREGCETELDGIHVKIGETSSPNLLSETELITLMDKHQIGTDATMHEHIKTITSRQYIERVESNRFRPTLLGVALYLGLHNCCPELTLPTIRADMERSINAIAAGERDARAGPMAAATKNLKMLKVLMVAEKPSVAEAIAKALASKAPDRSTKSLLDNQPAIVTVTSSTGHLFSLDFAPKYNDRNKVDETDLFEAQVIKKAENSKVINHLQTCAKAGIDRLVLWLDCDKEGENICFEVLKILQPYLPGKSIKIPSKAIERVKFSSLVPSDLRQAYKSKRVNPNEAESLSVDARQELDLKIGVSFTRFFTRYLKDFHGGTVSYGPCQMPTLWFCVRREEEIETFKPQKYFTIQAKVLNDLSLLWSGGKIYDEASARALSEYFEDIGTGKVIRSKSVKRKSNGPTPFNTMDMLKAASNVLGMAPQRAMTVAEALYLSGCITYPRTESTKFAPAFNLAHVIDTLSNDNSIVRSMAQQLKKEGFHFPTKGIDVGDHPPITPCGSASSFMTSDHERLYRLICCQFFQSLASPAEYRDHYLEVMVEGKHSFKTKSSSLEKRGYLNYSFHRFDDGEGVSYDERSDSESDDGYMISTATSGVSLDSIREGDTIKLSSATVINGVTKAPEHMTEAELLTLMERFGIGTDASVTTHIANILQRDYVRLDTRGGRRYMIPTDLGQTLCRVLTRIDTELTSPRVRAIIENSCKQIALARIDKDRLVKHVLKEFGVKFQYVLRNMNLFDDLVNISERLKSAEPLSRCGKCKRYMVMMNQRRLVCQKCSIALTLPQRVKVRTVGGEVVCVYDNFELLVAVEKSDKAWCFCPLCWSHPPPGAAMPGTPFRCLDSNEKLLYGSAYRSNIAKCKDREASNCSESAAIYLQNYSGGCKMGIACSECSFYLSFDVNKVKRIDKLIFPEERCTTCGWMKVSARLTPKFMEESKIEEDVIKGCIGCHPVLAELLAGQVQKKRKSFRRPPRRGR